MDESKTKVYIQADEDGRILRCEGGCSAVNIKDYSAWVEIDEGVGRRYDCCQSLYFDGGLYTDDGVPRYVYENGVCRLRTVEEIDADTPAPDTGAGLSLKERINDLEIALCELFDSLA